MINGIIIATYICCAEGLQVMANRHQHQAKGCRDGHEQEALRSAPEVEDLCQGNVDGGREGISHDIDDIEQRVRFPITRGVG